jgi:hypothetical protein
MKEKFDEAREVCNKILMAWWPTRRISKAQNFKIARFFTKI